MKIPRDPYTIVLPTLRQPTPNWHDLNRLLSLEKVYGGLPNPKGFSGDLIEVSSGSRVTYRNAVQAHATFFRREFHYDFIQYDAEEHDPNCRVFMWVEQRHYPAHAVGSVCFRFRPYRTAEGTITSGWAMMWIWLHPYCRRQGLLKSLWPYLLHRFGSFYVEPPHSAPMRQWLATVGDPWGSNPTARQPGLDPGGQECTPRTFATLEDQSRMAAHRGAVRCSQCPRPVCPSSGSHIVECKCAECRKAFLDITRIA
jgi:hypothetical protein